MWITTILPSDQKPIDIKVLPLYALDSIGPKDPGDFTFKIRNLWGDVLEQPYDLQTRLNNPPQTPGPDEDDTWLLTEWERFQAAIAHSKRRFELSYERAKNIAQFVLASCLKPEDRERIIEPADYDCIYAVAMAREVNGEEVRRQLADFFRGDFRESAGMGRSEKIRPDRGGDGDGLRSLSSLGNRIAGESQTDDRGVQPNTSGGTDADGAQKQNRRLVKRPRRRKATQRTDAPVTLGMIASIILYQAREAEGLGFAHWPELSLWTAYYQSLKKEAIEKYIKAQVLEASIEATRGQVIRLLIQAQGSPQQAELLKEADKLNRFIKKMRRECQSLLA